MGIQDFVRWFTPREDHFYDFLEKQAEKAHQGALALGRFKDDRVSAEEVRSAVQALEHEGDKLVHELEESLAKTFVTPIDREDIQKLSSELDDVLDFTNGAARVCVLYGVKRPTAPMIALMETLSKCTEILTSCVPYLRTHQYELLIEATRKIRALEKEADTTFRDAISQLFLDDSVDAKKLIREREVLDDLEKAVDYCERVSGTLANLAVKNG